MEYSQLDPDRRRKPMEKDNQDDNRAAEKGLRGLPDRGCWFRW